MSFLRKIFSKHEAPIHTYADFWVWFQQHEREFFKILSNRGDMERDFFARIAPRLDQLYGGFLLLASMVDTDTAELTFTVDGDVKRIVFAEELVGAAPALPGWKIKALKSPVVFDDVEMTMNGFVFDDKRLSFYSNDDAGHPDEVSITVVHQDLNEGNRDKLIHGIYVFLDNCLGELNFVEDIDRLSMAAPGEAAKPLVPIAKLRDFLAWRKAEFVEKYEAACYNAERDNYSALEARLPNGKPLIAIINTTLLGWEGKASHPWIVRVCMKYEGDASSGMPDDEAYDLLDRLEEEIMSHLEDHQGYLNVGRQTADGVREVYFACKNFRKPSKVLYQVANTYGSRLEISYDIFKDKYWQSFERFRMG